MNGRILVLLGDSFDAPGGIAQYNRDLIAAWSASSAVNEIVLVPRFGPVARTVLPPKTVQRAPVPGLFAYVLGAVSTSVRYGPFDFVFCAHLNFSPLASFVSRLLAIPMWLQLHGIEAWKKPSRLVRCCAEKSSLVTSVSRHTRRMFLRWADLQPHMVHVLPNTVGEQFTVNGVYESAVEKYGLSGKRILLTVSRLSKQDRYKGHDAVIRCLPALCAEFDNLVYVIAGDGDFREELQDLAKSLRVDRCVRFLGPIEHDDLPALYRAADLFVMPSTGEGFGIVYLEAIACGTPVIAGDSDGAEDPLQSGALGVRTSREELPNVIADELRSIVSAAQTENTRLVRAESVSRSFAKSTFFSTVRSITRRACEVGCA